MTAGRTLRALGLTLLLVPASSVPARTDCLTFSPGTAYACGPSPFRVLVRDFNSDGKPDLAAVDNAGPDVSILLGTGDGTFAPHVNYPVGLSAGQITAADFNRDGFLDIAVNAVNNVSVLLGRGDGTFASQLSYPVGPAPNGITNGDFNADGMPDIAVVESQGNSVSILLGRPAGGFSPRVDYAAGASPYAIQTGDFNEDGITDLVVTNQSGSDVSILLGRGSGGRGDGTFAGAVSYPVQQYPYSVATGDFNADGITDLAVANGGTATVSILLGRGSGGTGDGTFAAAVNVPGGTQPRDIASADFDGDGILDLALADYGGSVQILLGLGTAGQGNGMFATPLAFPDGTTPTGIAVADLDRNGKLDLATANYLGNTVSVMLHVCPEPVVSDVRDVPNDQGGRVFLTWLRSGLDAPGAARVTGYRVWRRIPAGAASEPGQGTAPGPTGAAPPPSVLAVRAAGPGGTSEVTYWEAVATLPAERLAGYGYTAPTTQDSTERGNPYTAFFVTAVTADASVFYQSNVDSGYSVDNLSPPMPVPFVATYGASSNTLHWSASRAPDFREFRLHRGTSPAFVPGVSNLVFAAADTGFVDAPGAFFYKLSAVDVHGNSSRFSLVSPMTPVATLASLVSLEVRADRIQLTWYSGGGPGLTVSLYRRTAVQSWTPIDRLTPDGSGYVRYEDRGVVAGVRYGYRLGIMDGGVEVFAGEAWATADDPGFALEGVRPNPALSTQLTVQFVSPSAAPAKLELFDVAGRRQVEREVGSLGPGRHAVNLAAGARLAPGVYMVRFTQGTSVRTTRAVVLD